MSLASGTGIAIGTPSPNVGARRQLARSGRALRPFLYLLPAAIPYVLFLLLPLAHTVWISFYEWNGITPATWVGLRNYQSAIADPQVQHAFQNALILVGFYAILPVSAGLLLVGIMVRRPGLRGLAHVRAIVFLPQIIATVVIATMWAQLLGPSGPVNGFLDAVGLSALSRPWLGDFDTALPTIGLIGTWVQTGFCLLLFLSGAAQIPTELFEAARVDGANAWHEFFAVTLPGLRGQLIIALTLTVTAALRTFDLVYLATSGGPGNVTQVPALLVYRRAFTLNLVGSACAIGVMLMIFLILLGTFLITRLDTRGES